MKNLLGGVGASIVLIPGMVGELLERGREVTGRLPLGERE